MSLLSQARLHSALKRTAAWGASLAVISSLGLGAFQGWVAGNSAKDAKALFHDAQSAAFYNGYGKHSGGFDGSRGYEAGEIGNTSSGYFAVRAATSATAYRWLSQHSGGKKQDYEQLYDGTYFVTQSSPQHMTLEGRSGHGYIVEVSGTPQKITSVKVLNHGYLEPLFLLRLFGFETLPFLLLFLLIGASAEGAAKRRLKEWQRLIPADLSWGPLRPEDSFTLLSPVCREHASEPWFQTVTMQWKSWGWDEREEGEEQKTFENPDGTQSEKVWRAGSWQDPELLPKSITAQLVPAEENADAVSARWFDYVHAVADWNASRWQLRQSRELQLEEAQHLRSLTQGRGLGDLLPEAQELMRGLPLSEA